MTPRQPEKLEILKLLNTLTNILANWNENSYNVARSRISDWLGPPTSVVATIDRATVEPGKKSVEQPVEDKQPEASPRVINAQANTGLGLGAK